MLMAGANYDINWPNWDAFKTRTTERIIRLTVEECRLTAQRNASFGPYTKGRLATTIYATVRKEPNGWSASFGSRLPYAASVEGGAKRHIIRPRAISLGHGLYATGGELHFFWRKKGIWVHTRKVNHPGQKGKHFLRNALIRVAGRRGFRVVTR
jgi:hypothetical protein